MLTMPVLSSVIGSGRKSPSLPSGARILLRTGTGRRHETAGLVSGGSAGKACTNRNSLIASTSSVRSA